jgi:hypothetical protein
MTKKIQYFLFDAETGGKESKKHSLLTLYGQILNKNLIVIDEIDLILKPDDDIYCVRTDALETNKINLIEHGKKAISYSEARLKFEHFMIKNRGFNEAVKIMPVGWNTKFDIGFIQEYLMPPTLWDKYFSRDTIELKSLVHYLIMTKRLKIKNYNTEISLHEIINELKIDIGDKQYHSAKSDVEIEYILFKKLIEMGMISESNNQQEKEQNKL